MGKAFKNRRKLLNLSQASVAARIGMSRAMLSNFENGKLPELGVRKLIALGATLGLDLVVVEAASRPTLRTLLAERDGKNA